MLEFELHVSFINIRDVNEIIVIEDIASGIIMYCEERYFCAQISNVMGGEMTSEMRDVLEHVRRLERIDFYCVHLSLLLSASSLNLI
jgi:hypothetical protein